MENTGGNSSGDGRPSKKLPSSVDSVISNNDLLIQILLRLPVLSLVFFESVSKLWFSLIKDPSFALRQTRFPNFDAPCALFLKFYITRDNSHYKFVSLDARIPISTYPLHRDPFPFRPHTLGFVEILQSCNGLLLCGVKRFKKAHRYYVYNPTLNLSSRLPLPDSLTFICRGFSYFRLAFDPTVSPHYKVIHAEVIHDEEIDLKVQIQTYSSESHEWSVCGQPFPGRSRNIIEDGIYWDGAIHRLDHTPGNLTHYKLDIVNEHPVLAWIQLPATLNGVLEFQSNLFESRGRLLLIGQDYDNSRQLNIYEMRVGDSEWSVKYIVNLDDIMMPFPDRWRITESVCCIVLGDGEEDSYMVMLLHEKVLKYKIKSKTVSTLSELGPVDPRSSCYQFIPSFAGV